MKRLVIGLVAAILLMSALAGSAFAQPLPALPACAHNGVALAHTTNLPFTTVCFDPTP